MTRVYAPDVPAGAGVVDLHGDEAHHLTRVVRARAGDIVRLFDGRGHEWQARVAAVGRHAVTLEIVGAVAPVPEPAVAVTLAVGVLKGDQMDTVIRDATVMGAAAIVPLATDHVAVPGRAWRGGAAEQRWRRVAVAAAKQCGRSVLPDIAPVTSLAGLLGAARTTMMLACLEPSVVLPPATSSPPPALARDWRSVPRPASALLLVGPEGGWSAPEVEALAAAGAYPVSLGPRTLRAESAPLVAVTLLWATWGWEA